MTDAKDFPQLSAQIDQLIAEQRELGADIGQMREATNGILVMAHYWRDRALMLEAKNTAGHVRIALSFCILFFVLMALSLFFLEQKQFFLSLVSFLASFALATQVADATFAYRRATRELAERFDKSLADIVSRAAASGELFKPPTKPN